MQFRNFITSPRETSLTDVKNFSYYKQGVRVKFPKKSPPLRVQILPAYNPADPANGQGFVPCLSNGQPTSWFGMIQSAKFVGHGEWKSTLPILSLMSFEGSEPCPYKRLLDYCNHNQDWKYLVTKSGRFGAPDFRDAVLKPIKSVLLLNIVDVDDPGKGVQILETSYSVANTLLNEETGIVFQRNLQLENYPDAAAALARDPMLAYANGDITNPGRAPVFVIELPPVKAGQFGAGYTARIEVVGGQVTRRMASDIELSSRYHLDDPESFLNIPTGQDIVDTLVTLLKGHKNAMGVDETCAIAEAVGDTYRVDLTPAPGAVNAVQGWSQPAAPAMQAQASQAPIMPTPTAGNPPVMPTPAPAPQGYPGSQQVYQGATAPAAPAGAVPVAPATGFAPNPAAAQTAQGVGAIPGEPTGGDLASSLAARMRTQLNLRKAGV
jgi:hypothetical protein